MVSKVFLDANILLDFLLQRNDYAEARAVMQLIIDGHISGFTTPAIVHINAYWVTKAYGTNKAKELLLNLLDSIQIIDCDHDTAVIALNSRMDDIEDALQYYSALKFKLDFFISRDRKLKQEGIPALPVLTPSELLAFIQ